MLPVRPSDDVKTRAGPRFDTAGRFRLKGGTRMGLPDRRLRQALVRFLGLALFFAALLSALLLTCCVIPLGWVMKVLGITLG
jgi:hypothetical protein